MLAGRCPYPYISLMQCTTDVAMPASPAWPIHDCPVEGATITDHSGHPSSCPVTDYSVKSPPITDHCPAASPPPPAPPPPNQVGSSPIQNNWGAHGCWHWLVPAGHVIMQPMSYKIMARVIFIGGHKRHVCLDLVRWVMAVLSWQWLGRGPEDTHGDDYVLGADDDRSRLWGTAPSQAKLTYSTHAKALMGLRWQAAATQRTKFSHHQTRQKDFFSEFYRNFSTSDTKVKV